MAWYLGGALEARETALRVLREMFVEAGCTPLEPRHLLDADVLLDLYGEDIRTRAFLFPDPVTAGELCLRPDFTVPVAMGHGEGGWSRRAAYCYAGPVFRLQERSGRPTEYHQAGVERYGDGDRAAADAGIFSLILRGIEALGIAEPRVNTGDTGIFFALIHAIEMPERRRSALKRHFWRPARFRELVERYCAPAPEMSETRAQLIAAAGSGAEAVERLVMSGREVLGARGLDELIERVEDLRHASAERPMPSEQAELIEAVLSVRGPSGTALAQLRELSAAAGIELSAALERFEARLDALNRIGIDAEDLPFDARFGRLLEYYDGFVFEIDAGVDGDPPLAGGGRYDRMTQRLGADRPVPAVGAMIRPEAVLAAVKGGAS